MDGFGELAVSRHPTFEGGGNRTHTSRCVKAITHINQPRMVPDKWRNGCVVLYQLSYIQVDPWMNGLEPLSLVPETIIHFKQPGHRTPEKQLPVPWEGIGLPRGPVMSSFLSSLVCWLLYQGRTVVSRGRMKYPISQNPRPEKMEKWDISDGADPILASCHPGIITEAGIKRKNHRAPYGKAEKRLLSIPLFQDQRRRETDGSFQRTYPSREPGWDTTVQRDWEGRFLRTLLHCTP